MPKPTFASRLIVIAASLLLVGAGCQNTMAIPANRMNEETAISPPSQPVRQVQPPAVDEQPTDSAQPKSSDNKEWPRPTSFPGILSEAETKNKVADIKLDRGIITFEILADEAPKAASNFIALARSGYYDGLVFHRVVPGFVIQGGDPLGTGTGGPGYKFEDDPVSLSYDAGIVAMANAGPNTNGSQFFIVIDDQPTLPKSYSIFGRVIAGQSLVKQVQVGEVMRQVIIRNR